MCFEKFDFIILVKKMCIRDSTYTKEAFIKRNKNIYDGMEVTDINIDVVSTDGDKITYTVNMKTVAGSTEFENTTQFLSLIHIYMIQGQKKFMLDQLVHHYYLDVNS